MSTLTVNIRHAKQEDLDNMNHVIEAAVMTWNLPERVKRLSLSSYDYTEVDFAHLEIMVAEDEKQNIIGVAAWEHAELKDTPAHLNALLLHGIYVDPTHYHKGIGKQLFQAAEQATKDKHFDGLLVKAQAGAEGFFLAMGMHPLSVENTGRQYANRFWKNMTN